MLVIETMVDLYLALMNLKCSKKKKWQRLQKGDKLIKYLYLNKLLVSLSAIHRLIFQFCENDNCATFQCERGFRDL